MDYLDIIQPKYLTREFLDQYKDKKPPFGQLGLVVFLRTYSRYIDELKRREHWWETIVRVVEFSISLIPDNSFFSFNNLQKEAESLYDYLFNMKVFPAGRTLFTGDKNADNRDNSRQFNCSFAALDSIKSFVDGQYLLLNGAGFGFSVEEKYIKNIPSFNTKVKINHLPINPKKKEDRLEFTQTITTNQGKNIIIEVGDSKKGWCDALYTFLDYLTQDVEKISFVYDSVRPEGERLKKFGGRASGYMPLQNMFLEIEDRIIECNGVLTSVAAMDIMNSIAKAIVVGGSRRSSQLALGDLEDIYFISAKTNLWSDPKKEKYRTTRVLSNNSIMFWQKPSLDKLKEVFNDIKISGEPKYIWAVV